MIDSDRRPERVEWVARTFFPFNSSPKKSTGSIQKYLLCAVRRSTEVAATLCDHKGSYKIRRPRGPQKFYITPSLKSADLKFRRFLSKLLVAFRQLYTHVLEYCLLNILAARSFGDNAKFWRRAEEKDPTERHSVG